MNIDILYEDNLIRLKEYNKTISKIKVLEFVHYGVHKDFILDITYVPCFNYDKTYKIVTNPPISHIKTLFGIQSIDKETRRVIQQIQMSCTNSAIDYFLSLNLDDYEGIIIYDEQYTKSKIRKGYSRFCLIKKEKK